MAENQRLMACLNKASEELRQKGQHEAPIPAHLHREMLGGNPETTGGNPKQANPSQNNHPIK